MILIHHERGNFWLRLKSLLTLGGAEKNKTPAIQMQPKPKRRSHRTTAFFEMP
jgi:hypothetical protein